MHLHFSSMQYSGYNLFKDQPQNHTFTGTKKQCGFKKGLFVSGDWFVAPSQGNVAGTVLLSKEIC